VEDNEMKSFRLTVVLVLTVLFLSACPIKNSKPEWGVIETIVENIGELIQINLANYCSDPDGHLLSYSLIGGPGTVSGSLYEWTVSRPLGDNAVTIRAEDEKEASSDKTFTVTVKSFPNVPSNPSPANGAKDTDLEVLLSWEGEDPDGDAVLYDLYLSTFHNPSLFRSNRTTNTYNESGLLPNTTYYWKIAAKNEGSEPVVGPIWSFTTKK